MTRSQTVAYVIQAAVILIAWGAAAGYVTYATWGHPNFGWMGTVLVAGFMWFGFGYATWKLWTHFKAARAFPDLLR